MTLIIVFVSIIAWFAAGHFVGKKAAPIAYANHRRKYPYSSLNKINYGLDEAKCAYYSSLLFFPFVLVYVFAQTSGNNVIRNSIPTIAEYDFKVKQRELEEQRIEINREARRLGMKEIDFNA